MTRTILVLSVLVPLLSSAQEAFEIDAPTTVIAVQDRAYQLQNEFDLGIGALPLDPFTKTYYAQAGYTLHFNDLFAIQARFAYGLSVRTSLREQLERDFGQLPTAFDQAQFFAGGDILFKPLYGKLTLLNRYVIHGEAYVLAGGTVFKFSSAFKPGVNLGGGVRVFLTKVFSVRFDLTDAIVLPGGLTPGLSNVLTATLTVGMNLRLSE